MRNCTALLITLGFCIGPGPTWARGADMDSDSFQGTWTVVSGERDGKKLSDEDIGAMEVAFKGDKVVVSRKAEAEPEASFSLDPAKKPKTIDITPKSQGIYELDGDRLKIRFIKDGSARPTAFTEPTKKSEMMIVLKRKKT